MHRAMGHFIRFINNRDLAAENIMTAYARQRVILDSAPGTIGALNARLHDLHLDLPKRSALVLAADLKKSFGSVAGEFTVTVTPSRRNSQVPTHLAYISVLYRSK